MLLSLALALKNGKNYLLQMSGLLRIIDYFSKSNSINLFLTLTLTVLDVSAVDRCLGRTVQIVPRPRSQPCAGHFRRSQNCFNY